MSITILTGDCIASMRGLPDQSVHTCVTSPPYFGLRDYGMPGQIGLEPTPAAFVSSLVEVFREVRRVLRDDGTLWLNLGDSYAGTGKTGGGAQGAKLGVDGAGAGSPTGKGTWFSPKGFGLKVKDLIGIPWRVAFALQDDGWYLRQDIIWHKPNPMPESVTDRCTKAHEYLFLLSKGPRYYFDSESIKEPISQSSIDRWGGPVKRKSPGSAPERNDYDAAHKGETTCGIAADGMRNRRSVWTVTTKPFKGAHFATFPPDLIEPCILAGSPVGGTVLDPFGGSGTTGGAALKIGRKAILCELNPEYAAMMPERIASIAGHTQDLFARAAE